MCDTKNSKALGSLTFAPSDTCTDMSEPRDFSHLWIDCDFCEILTYHKIVKEKFYICESCGSNIKMKSSERIDFLLDSDTWEPMDEQLRSLDPIQFDSLDPLHFDSLDSLQDPIEDPMDFDSVDGPNDPENPENPENPDDSGPKDPKTPSTPENPDDSGSEDSDPDDSGSEDSDPEDSDPEDSNPEDSDAEDLIDKNAELEASADSYYRDLGICIYVDKEEIPFHKASDSEYEGEGEPVVIDPEDDAIEGGVLVEGEITKEDLADIRCLLWMLSLLLEKKEEEENVKIDEEEENVKIDEDEENVKIEDEETYTDEIKKIEDEETYTDKIKRNEIETGLSEAVETGTGKLNGIKIALGVMDFRFIGGSMGSVVGEKITRLIEHATKKFLPLILVCASGGARMQEGSLSLMQMAKISSALSKYRDQKNKSNQKLFYISILTTPTTGGVTASFAMLGDIIIAEPDAYIAFAGKRVIEELFHIEVPEGSQEAEVLFEKGFLDLIVPRNLLKSLLTELLQFHSFSFDPTLLSPKLIRRLFQNFVQKKIE